MNAKLNSLLVLAAGLSLSGCRTMDEPASLAPAAKPAPPGSTYDPRIENDADYVAYVENMARRRGVIVRWVNKPVKRHVDQE
jgi:hypothetical protein